MAIANSRQRETARTSGDVVSDWKLEQIAAALISPVKITPAMLRIKIRAIYEGVEIPTDRKRFVALAIRAGVGHNRRYEAWREFEIGIDGGTSAMSARIVALATQAKETLLQVTALYRYYDEADLLLYVGISDGLYVRLNSHIDGSTWMEFAVRSTIIRPARKRPRRKWRPSGPSIRCSITSTTVRPRLRSGSLSIWSSATAPTCWPRPSRAGDGYRRTSRCSGRRCGQAWRRGGSGDGRRDSGLPSRCHRAWRRGAWQRCLRPGIAAVCSGTPSARPRAREMRPVTMGHVNPVDSRLAGPDRGSRMARPTPCPGRGH